MMLFLCFLMLFLVISLLAGGVYVYLQARTILSDVNSAFQGFFEADTEGQSDFARLIAQIVEVQTAALGTTIQAGIRGSLGGQMTGIIPALEKEAYDHSPELAIADILPKSLKKNSAAQFGLQLLLQRLIPKLGAGGANNGGSGSSEQVKFNL